MGLLLLSAPQRRAAAIASSWWPSCERGMRPSLLSLLCATTRIGFSPASGIICSRSSRPSWVVVCALFHALLASSRSHRSPSLACASSIACSALRVIAGSHHCLWLPRLSSRRRVSIM